MVAIFGALFPIFALVVLGYAVGRKQWLGADADHVLNAYVANIALPALTLNVLASMHGPDLVEPVMFLVVVGGAALMFAGHYIYERWRGLARPEANAAAFGASYGNHAFIGLPVCLAFLGPESLAPAAVVVALNSAFVFGGGAMMSVLTAPATSPSGQGEYRGERKGAAVALLLVLRNPLVIAAILGVTLASTDAALPTPVSGLLAMIGATTAPCALIAVGLFMARPVPNTGGTGATVRSLIGKLLMLPILAAAMLWILPPMPPAWHNTALIMAAVPAGSGCFALARYGGEGALRMAARIIAISTLISAITLPILLLLIGRGL